MVTTTRFSLPALALGAFAVGCTEFVAVGLVPDVSRDLGVSEAAAGQLVTLNALAVVLAAPLLGTVSSRWACRPVLLVTLTAFAAAHLLAAAAPTFGVLLASRLLSGAGFGTVLAVAFTAASRLAAPGTRARSLATVQAGVATATALGVPLGSVLGATGWRVPFAVIAVVALLAAAAIAMAVPRLDPVDEPSLRRRLGVLVRPPVAHGLATIVVFWAASFCAFTYLLPLLAERTGLTGSAASAVVLLAGVTSVAGTVLGGRWTDRAPHQALVGSAAVALAGLVALFAVGGPVVVAALVLWQLGAWSFVQAARARVQESGGPAGEAAVSFSVSAFNVGIVAGAGLGGAALATGGLTAVGVAAVGFGVVALLLVVPLARRPSPVRFS